MFSLFKNCGRVGVSVRFVLTRFRTINPLYGVYKNVAIGFTSRRYITVKPAYPPIATDLISKLQIPKQRAKVMDLCAGTGSFISILEHYFINNIRHNERADIIAVESMDNSIHILNDKFKSNHNIIIKKGSPYNLTQLELKQSIDAIFCAQKFHYFAQQNCLNQIYDILSSNGYLFLIWNNETYHNNAFLKDLETNIINLYGESSYKQQKNIILQLLLNGENKVKFNLMNNDYITFAESLKERLNVNMMIDRMLSKSVFSLKTQKEKYEIKVVIHELVKKHYGSIDKAQIAMYYDTDVLIAQKR